MDYSSETSNDINMSEALPLPPTPPPENNLLIPHSLNLKETNSLGPFEKKLDILTQKVSDLELGGKSPRTKKNKCEYCLKAETSEKCILCRKYTCLKCTGKGGEKLECLACKCLNSEEEWKKMYRSSRTMEFISNDLVDVNGYITASIKVPKEIPSNFVERLVDNSVVNDLLYFERTSKRVKLCIAFLIGDGIINSYLKENSNDDSVIYAAAFKDKAFKKIFEGNSLNVDVSFKTIYESERFKEVKGFAMSDSLFASLCVKVRLFNESIEQILNAQEIPSLEWFRSGINKTSFAYVYKEIVKKEG